eukprot:TRINITY_DN3036_c0_g1_i1.p1 TRINITY_DN3036_c0_g1~~TRINITY_DN3036_c0_g1_i1.p1  ORF type:complete len:292 (+),score=77.93 TRINITY_DN3036_c0_g1_i1:602-1477(+)
MERLKGNKSRFSVRTHEAFYSARNSTVSFLMDLLDFGSLERCLRELRSKGQRMSESDLAHVSWCCLSALAELRRQHIVHKDVKPDNILVGFRGEVKLGDFGVSSFTDQDSRLPATGSGSTKWMAPERARGLDFSYNSDVYSLGLSVAYMTLGRYPLKTEPVFVRAVSDDELDMAGFEGSKALRAFIDQSTLQDPAVRPDAETLRKDAFTRASTLVPSSCDLLSFLKHLDKYEAVDRTHALTAVPAADRAEPPVAAAATAAALPTEPPTGPAAAADAAARCRTSPVAEHSPQ